MSLESDGCMCTVHDHVLHDYVPLMTTSLIARVYGLTPQSGAGMPNYPVHELHAVRTSKLSTV